ncbi:DUF3540 domain-containing protein [Bermanella sp. R86510]|uniref:DUF3540 domain-containing protein n=1 Tax=unclassified Bermanella TaxID=2627862 RepID=UPI0037CA8141
MNTHDIATAMIKQQRNESLDHSAGTVTAITQESIAVRLISGETVTAKKAFSCAFEPVDQDFVEVTLLNNTYYILNILERHQSSVATLSSPMGIELSSPSITMQSNAMAISNQTMNLSTGQYHHQSENINVHTDGARLTGRTVETNTERLISRIKDSFRIIERIEQVSAKDIIQNIKNAFIQRSRQVDITAKSDVKINGDRIHMG